MRTPQMSRKSESGIILLLTLLIMIALSALTAGIILVATEEIRSVSRQRSNITGYYAAYAGTQEAASRLVDSNPAAFSKSSTPMPTATGQAVYVLNPDAGESVDPANLSASNPYRDTEYQDEFGTPVSGASIKTVASAQSALFGQNSIPYKWARITIKTEKSSGQDINGDGTLDASLPVYYDGRSQTLTPTGYPVFKVTSLGVTPTQQRYMVQEEVAVTPAATIPVLSAIFVKADAELESALNVTGFTDPVCSSPATYGIQAGTAISGAGGSGNITGSPAGYKAPATFPYDVKAIIASLQPSSSPIDSPGTGVTQTAPGQYAGPHATLGVPPTVTYDSNGAITAITAPGVPRISYSPGNLTLGTSVFGGTPVQGYGVLLVNGHLTLDATNGLNFFGLIVATGGIDLISAKGAPVSTANIHGMILGSASFDSTLNDPQGGIFVHQNACMVRDGLASTLRPNVLAFRQITNW